MVGTRTGDGGFILVKDSELKIQTTHDNCPEVENYWSQKYDEKMKKCYHFFVFLLKMITTNNYKPEKISISGLQNKKSKLGIVIKTFQFCMTEEKQLCICAEDLWLFLIMLLLLPVNVL